MKKRFLYSGLMCFITHLTLLFSQNRINDAGAWLSLAVSYKTSSNQELSVMARYRQYENFTQANSWYVDMGYAYRISPAFKLSLHYALNPTRTKENIFIPLHQYYLRMDYRKFINKYFTFYNRIILQHTNRFIADIDNGSKPYYRTDFRERMGISFNLSSVSNIYLHNEWMYTLSEIPVELKRNRLYIGYEKVFRSTFSAKWYFVLQSSFHKRKNPNTNHFIFGMDLNININ